MKQLICILLLLAGMAQSLLAQEPSLTLQCAPDSVQLGTAFHCNCQLALPKGASLRSLQLSFDSLKVLQAFIPGMDTLPTDYEVLSYGNWSPADKQQKLLPNQMTWQPQEQGGMSIYQNALSVVFWQPGVFLLPALSAEVEWNGQGYDVLSNEQALMVMPPNQDQVSQLDSMGMAPIKSIIETERTINWKFWALVGAGCLALIALIAFLLARRSQANYAPPVVIPLTAHEKAYKALEKIKQRGDWNQGEFKKYYDELTHVLRQYLEDRYEVPALESTTDEILRALDKTELPSNFIQGMQRLLPMTDMVKFAKMQPHEEEHPGWLSWVRELVDTTKKEIIESAENETAGE